MEDNPLRTLKTYGQSVWLDLLRRSLITGGMLERLVDEDGLSGITSNPKIFDKAIEGSDDYDADLRALHAAGHDTARIQRELMITDIQLAADVLRPVYERTGGGDGFVSLEVSPHLARDTAGTVREAGELWEAVDRPNLLIKIPATVEGLPAIRRCLAAGININVTLLFGLSRYRQVAEAYLQGLEDRLGAGQPVDRIASVASFFLSRIDVLVDRLLEEIEQQDGPRGRRRQVAQQLRGRVAIASARAAHAIYREIVGGDRFRALERRGARPQRLLWASTSTKNPEYSDVKYVEALIGPDTVNTMPLETLDAYRDHGRPAPRLEGEEAGPHATLATLTEIGIDIDRVTEQLEEEGIEKFVTPHDRLLEAIGDKRRRLGGTQQLDRQLLELGEAGREVRARLEQLGRERFGERLWRREPDLWTSAPAAQETVLSGLGWLHVADTMAERLGELHAFSEQVRRDGFERIVHMGMGGSSLTPLVLARTFGTPEGGLPLTVLDTTDPASVAALEASISIGRTLFIVASKSGTTTEPLAFADTFFARVQQARGDAAGRSFVAITDPGTPLVEQARERGYRTVWRNPPDIGGRYSALSYFGLVPAALMGLDVGELLERALRMQHACGPTVPAVSNPGLALGATLAVLARRGRDKVTFVAPGAVEALPLWLEQLLAESTGKEGKGLVPVAGEQPGDPAVYGDDRLFVAFRVAGDGDAGAPDDANDRAVDALEQAGHPVVRITLGDRLDLAGEFFRWEFATAVAGSLLGINAFDQPNVQESKDVTAGLLAGVANGQSPDDEPPACTDSGIAVYGRAAESVEQALEALCGEVRAGDYLALLAYLPESAEHEAALQRMRHALRDRLRVATTLGYGPRYLHSTGQLHKGGPDTGVFILLTAARDGAPDVPGRAYDYGTLEQAQALGDARTLREHGRRVLRLDLGRDVARGLRVVEQALEAARFQAAGA